jgi:hypothetical protein
VFSNSFRSSSLRIGQLIGTDAEPNHEL